MRRRTLALLTLLLAAAPPVLAAQAREITGKVTQTAVGTPLTEATVSVLGSQVGVRTNERGEYRLKVPAGEVTILARAIGFKRTSVKLTATQATADFSLEKDVLELEGVTVTGQATTVDKHNASTAVATISAEELIKVPAKSVEGNLQGKVVGATIFENSGVPGGGMQIQIRGATSILGSGDPLYVVDGVIISNASVSGGLASITRSSGSTASTQDQTVNRLADLNPDDVENIEVLKSAAATAIYGSRATNGVIVITTKKGKAGTTKYNFTQRMGTQQATRLLGSRAFASYDLVKPFLGSSPHADSIAKANCTPACPHYDWAKDFYNNTTPSFETIMSTSGGTTNTRFFASVNDKQTHGVEQNTGARRTSGRVNLDQTIGDKISVSGGATISRDFVQDGIGNNDNAGVSPGYALGYTPEIYDIQKIDPATGRLVFQWMNGGGSGASNMFDVIHSITNQEDTWRQMGNVRVGYSALSTVHNILQLTYIGGVDRFQLSGQQYSPNFLQFEPADGFLGTSQVISFESRFVNQGINVVWTFNPGWRWFNSAQSSGGGTYETQLTNGYNVRHRGLTPSRVVPTNGTDIATSDAITEFRDQSRYFNEQIIGLDEKLALSFGIRADRGSANGDRNTFYTFPKYSASYRFVEPLHRFTSAFDELKFRASFGQSGNRPNYGVRDINIAAGGVIGGLGSLVASGTVGNPAIKPEVMNEQEYGLDAALFHGRVGLELSHYERVIKDLLVTFPLAGSSGFTSQTINGGQMSTRGFEGGLSIVPISTKDVEWTFRTTYQHNVQYVDKLLVAPFAPGGNFGVRYGRNRIVVGSRPTYIWGNVPFSCINKTDATTGALVVGTGADGKPCHRIYPGDAAVAGSTVRDSIIADANPQSQTSFLNTIRWKRFTVTGLVDWRVGGYTADMTKASWDEGGNSRDYDQPSPVANQVLGQFRNAQGIAGNIATDIDNGTYVKLRELNVSFQAPKSWARLARATDMRIAVQGRNLFMHSDYWSYDPEFNNFGNSNFNRFIDLGPYPSNRQFFFSIDLGY